MTVKELQEELKKMSIPRTLYCINGSVKSDVYVLREVYKRWEYFYMDERGNENDNKWFDNEDDACAYFLNVLKKECSYRKRYT